MNPKAYRLPTTVHPRHYDIALDARLGRAEFLGTVTIQLDVQAPTNTIELHARDLQVSDAQLRTADQTVTGAIQLDADRETATIEFEQNVPAGPASLSLAFAGQISNSREGLFESKDGPDDLLCTQCEPTGARAIVPCFDEPTFKATMAWQVTTAPDAKVLTNGRLLSTTPSADGASATWTFAPTKPLSTYLLALAIGDIASTEQRVVNGIPLTIWAPKGREQLGQFGLEYTSRLLPFYEDYFAAPYHFEKLDQIGVPSFFGGAMENAGLIISDYSGLLLDPQSANRDQEITAATIIAHEFAHMWFGDLVTMRWWDDLWLNEAFASWMSYHALDTLSPEYRIWDEIQPQIDFALTTDALASSHAIYHPVETSRGIMENIDVITYVKGGAVLRMIHDFLGAEAFRAGLRTYMAEFGEKNATGPDLWRHLQQASHLPVGQVMETWITQAGHPLVEVEIESTDAGTQLHLTQRRFFSSAEPPTSDQMWLVPLTIRYEDSAGVHTTRYLLTERSATLPLPVTGELQWCYANAGEIGFYRQQLDAEAQRRVLAHLDRLTAAEQKGLLRDQVALVTNGTQRIPDYLDTIGALANGEDQTLVGQLVSDHLRRVQGLLEVADDATATAGFRAWVGNHFRERLNELEMQPQPGESAETAQMRAYVISAMATLAQNPQVIDQVRAWQAREEADVTSVDPTLAPIFVGATAQFGDATTYDRFLAIYQQRKEGGFTPQQTEYYAQALARFQQPELVQRTLQLLGDFSLPFITIGGILSNLIQQPRTATATWEWMKQNWALIQERAPMFVPPLVEASGVLPPTLRGDVAAFWEANLHGEYAGNVARALEHMDQRADFQARTSADLLAYFTSRAPGAPTSGDAQPASAPTSDQGVGTPSSATTAAPEATDTPTTPTSDGPTASASEETQAASAPTEVAQPRTATRLPTEADAPASPTVENAPVASASVASASAPQAEIQPSATAPTESWPASESPAIAPATATASADPAKESSRGRRGWLRRLFGSRR